MSESFLTSHPRLIGLSNIMEDRFFLSSFKIWLAQNGRRQGTVGRHFWNMRGILNKLQSFTKAEIDSLLLSMFNNKKSPNYLNSITTSIRVYAQYLDSTGKPVEKELLTYPLWKRIEAYKATLTDEEIERILNCSRIGSEWVESHHLFSFFFEILAYTGMRPGELASLTCECIDLGRNVFVLTADTVKTGHMRYVPIPPNLRDKIHTVVAIKKPNELFFTIPLNGQRIDNVAWNYHFNRRLDRLNLRRKGVTLYSLRHSFITHMLEEDVNLFKVQKIVGHRDIKTTAHYTHLTTKDLQKTLTKLPLLRDKLDPRETLNALKEFVNQLSLDKRFTLLVEDKGNSLRIEVGLLS